MTMFKRNFDTTPHTAMLQEAAYRMRRADNAEEAVDRIRHETAVEAIKNVLVTALDYMSESQFEAVVYHIAYTEKGTR